MIQYPKAKINLGLYVTEKRSDGYHNLETIMIPIDWVDVLELMPNETDGIHCTVSGLIETVGEENSCTQAYQLLAEKYELPSVQMHLHKQIPTGAGLGGGSSDAASALNMLNEMFTLHIDDATLENYAAQLGADNAFFIREGAKYCTGIGDVMEDLPRLNLAMHLVVVNPGIHVSTAEAYAGVTPQTPNVDLKELWLKGPESWSKTMQNDFELSVFKSHPEIEKLKNMMYQLGATYAAMSGSGSTVFGLFKEAIEVPELPSHYQVHQSILSL